MRCRPGIEVMASVNGLSKDRRVLITRDKMSENDVEGRGQMHSYHNTTSSGNDF